MDIDATFQCAVCGETNYTGVDSSGGAHQTYVEDCQICCRPNVLDIVVEWDLDWIATIHAEPESDAFG